jgi:two-component sensor histidine kinase/PAS domain-containing protein
MEVEFRGKNGKRVLAEGDASVRLQGGKPVSVRAIFRDVTATRMSEARAAEQQARLESIFESTRNMSMWTLNRDSIITACNRNFVQYMRQQFGENVRVGDEFMKRMESHIDPNHYLGELQAFKDAFGGEAKQFEVALNNQAGETLWLQVFLNPVSTGEVTEEISCLTYDITDRKEIDQQIRDSLQEKNVLLQEVHHRVKNNLQVISSILNLQSSYVQDEGTLEILQESQNRIKSMSYIHETLYRTTDFSSIEFSEYIQNIARNLIHTYSFTTGEVKLDSRVDQIYLTLDQAIPCGLIINELVSNAMKYAFKGIDDRKLTLEITEVDDQVRILVADNGIGLPADFRYEESDSLGVQLVYTLVEQLDGQIEVDATSGTRFLITFDKPQHP